MGDPIEIELGHEGDPSGPGRGSSPRPPGDRERPGPVQVLTGLAGVASLVVVVAIVLSVVSGGSGDRTPAADDQAAPENAPEAALAPDPPGSTAAPWTAPTLPEAPAPEVLLPPCFSDDRLLPGGVMGGGRSSGDPTGTTDSGNGGTDPATSPDRPSDAASADVGSPSGNVRVRELGRPLGLVPTSTVVVGLAVGGDLVEIDLDLGTIRRTRLPDPVPDRADVDIIAASGATVISGSVGEIGERVVYVVPIGEPARRASGALAGPWIRIEPGPVSDTVWVITGVGDVGDVGADEVGDVGDVGAGDVGDVGAGDVGDHTGAGRQLVDVLTGEPVDDLAADRLAPAGTPDAPNPADIDPERQPTEEMEAGPGSGSPADGATTVGSDRLSPSGATAVVTVPAPDGEGTRHDLVDLATGETVVLVSSHRPGRGVSENVSIEWSSDGRVVLFLDALRLVQHDTVSGVRALVGGFGDLMEIRRFTVRPAT